MQNPKYKVFVLEPIHKRALAVLEQRAEVVFAERHDDEYLKCVAKDVDAIVKRDRGLITRELMAASPRLKVVGRHGVGVDCIDVKAAEELGIYVVNTPYANVEAVAEHTLGMMLMLSKKMLDSDKKTRAGDWHVRYRNIGQELKGRSIGLVGFGKIAKRVAELCKAFEMQVYYYDVVDQTEAANRLGAKRLDLDELLSKCDYVSLHVPHTPATTHMIAQREFSLMRKDAYFLNLARGQCVDEAAMINALKNAEIAGAGLDVFEVEPLTEDNELLNMDNVIVHPHMAAHTDEALFSMGMVVADVIRVLDGLNPENPVNAPAVLR